MKNWWRARLCRGCKFLHIGHHVDHNHCDSNPANGWRQDRVNGYDRFNCSDFSN